MNPSPKDTGKPQFWTLRASSSYDNETDVFGEMLKPQDGDIRVCKLSEYELLERKLAKAVEQRNIQFMQKICAYHQAMAETDSGEFPEWKEYYNDLERHKKNMATSTFAPKIAELDAELESVK
jgi:hypothetical protein